MKIKKEKEMKKMEIFFGEQPTEQKFKSGFVGKICSSEQTLYACSPERIKELEAAKEDGFVMFEGLRDVPKRKKTLDADFAKVRSAIDSGEITPEKIALDGGCKGYSIDTEVYTYFFVLNEVEEWEDVYAYEKKWLDKFVADSSKGIRFIDSHCKYKFLLPDGGKVVFKYPDGTKSEPTICRYIDSCHVSIIEPTGYESIFHIGQLAEICERDGTEIVPYTEAM